MFNELSPWMNAAAFVAAALVVWFAGTRLARYADAIATRTVMSRAGTLDDGRHWEVCGPARVEVGQYFDGFDRDR